MEVKPYCDYTVHQIYELQVLALSESAVLPTKLPHENRYLLYSPYDCTVQAGCTKMISTDLSVSTATNLKHQSQKLSLFFSG